MGMGVLGGAVIEQAAPFRMLEPLKLSETESQALRFVLKVASVCVCVCVSVCVPAPEARFKGPPGSLGQREPGPGAGWELGLGGLGRSTMIRGCLP